MKQKYRKIIAAALCIFTTLSFPHKVSAVSVSAVSAVMIEAESGDIIYEKSAHKRMGMASTTKIMTAICAIENMPIDTVITIPPEAQGVEGSSVYLRAGEKLTLEELLYALMLQSANDAAESIAIAVSGSVEKFAELMNEKACELGLVDTHFENPHGLDGDRHYTTAYELAKIAAYALENETFADIVSTVKKEIPAPDGVGARILVNHNRLLRENGDIIGVKTGFTKKCGRTLVSAAEREGVRLICVTLNDADDWRDHRAMLDAGFKLYESVSLCESGSIRITVPVVGGVKNGVDVCNNALFKTSLPTDRGEITQKIELPRFIYAGQKTDLPVGRVRFFCEGREIGSVLLYISEETEKNKVKRGFFAK